MRQELKATAANFQSNQVQIEVLEKESFSGRELAFYYPSWYVVENGHMKEQVFSKLIKFFHKTEVHYEVHNLPKS